MLTHFRTRSLVLLLLLVSALPAAAVCPINPTHYFVGDTASDAACTQNTIQQAIDAVGSCPVVIDITREHLYGNNGFCTPGQTGGCHLNVANKNLTLQGWGDGVTCQALNSTICVTCGPGSTAPLVTLDGNNSGGSVLAITGSVNVSLRNLTISHGNAGSFNGGGIAFNGSGSLTLTATTVNLNAATNGAGINFKGTGSSAASLTLGTETQILANTASGSGGGIRIEGNARLFALAPQTLIGLNHAPNGYGGGIQVVGPALADIASPGYGTGGVIFDNDAEYGGGLSANATDDDLVHVRLFSTVATRPVRVSQNFASHTGGAIYMNGGDGSFSEIALLCAMDFRLDGNAAQEGTAIYGDRTGFYGSFVYLDTLATEPDCGFPESAATLGAVTCTAGQSCNLIDSNVAQDANGNPKPGSTILIQDTGYLTSSAVAMRNNTAASALHALFAEVSLHNCLIADGTYDGPVFNFELDGAIASAGFESLVNCTIAGNSIGSGSVISSSEGLNILDTIFAQPGTPSLSYTGDANNLAVQYVVSNSISTLPGGNDVVAGAPTFVDATAGDYHLQPASLGIDYAPPSGGKDIDGKPRDIDLPSITNTFGSRDLGAYERQNLFDECGTSNTLFCDGFGR